MDVLQMNRRKLGIALVIYGICAELVVTFANFAVYLNGQLIGLVALIFQPLALILPFTTVNSLIIGLYPLIIIMIGFYLAISKKKRKC
jgi:hypothetical protein